MRNVAYVEHILSVHKECGYTTLLKRGVTSQIQCCGYQQELHEEVLEILVGSSDFDHSPLASKSAYAIKVSIRDACMTSDSTQTQYNAHTNRMSHSDRDDKVKSL